LCCVSCVDDGLQQPSNCNTYFVYLTLYRSVLCFRYQPQEWDISWCALSRLSIPLLRLLPVGLNTAINGCSHTQLLILTPITAVALLITQPRWFGRLRLGHHFPQKHKSPGTRSFDRGPSCHHQLLSAKHSTDPQVISTYLASDSFTSRSFAILSP